MTKRLRFGLSPDFRNPPQWGRPFEELFPEVLDYISWAETLGFECVWFGEHHFIDDGYAPSPIVLASALSRCTKSIRISMAVILLPLYHPIRLAEDGALIDIFSGGRFDLGVGLGWRPAEFAAYEVNLRDAAARANESLEIIRRLWEGETLTYHGRFFNFDRVRITPPPVQKPRPRIWVGGYSNGAVRRAARFGDGYVGSNITEAAYHRYRAELRACGKDPAAGLVASGFRWFMVSHNPEATYADAAPYVLNWVNTYAALMQGTDQNAFTAAKDPAELRAKGLFDVVTPNTAVRMIKDYRSKVPCDYFNIKMLPPGYSIPKMMECLELFNKEVMPHFQ